MGNKGSSVQEEEHVQKTYYFKNEGTRSGETVVGTEAISSMVNSCGNESKFMTNNSASGASDEHTTHNINEVKQVTELKDSLRKNITENRNAPKTLDEHNIAKADGDEEMRTEIQNIENTNSLLVAQECDIVNTKEVKVVSYVEDKVPDSEISTSVGENVSAIEDRCMFIEKMIDDSESKIERKGKVTHEATKDCDVKVISLGHEGEEPESDFRRENMNAAEATENCAMIDDIEVISSEHKPSESESKCREEINDGEVTDGMVSNIKDIKATAITVEDCHIVNGVKEFKSTATAVEDGNIITGLKEIKDTATAVDKCDINSDVKEIKATATAVDNSDMFSGMKVIKATATSVEEGGIFNGVKEIKAITTAAKDCDIFSGIKVIKATATTVEVSDIFNGMRMMSLNIGDSESNVKRENMNATEATKHCGIFSEVGKNKVNHSEVEEKVSDCDNGVILQDINSAENCNILHVNNMNQINNLVVEASHFENEGNIGTSKIKCKEHEDISEDSFASYEDGSEANGSSDIKRNSDQYLPAFIKAVITKLTEYSGMLEFELENKEKHLAFFLKKHVYIDGIPVDLNKSLMQVLNVKDEVTVHVEPYFGVNDTRYKATLVSIKDKLNTQYTRSESSPIHISFVKGHIFHITNIFGIIRASSNSSKPLYIFFDSNDFYVNGKRHKKLLNGVGVECFVKKYSNHESGFPYVAVCVWMNVKPDFSHVFDVTLKQFAYENCVLHSEKIYSGVVVKIALDAILCSVTENNLTVPVVVLNCAYSLTRSSELLKPSEYICDILQVGDTVDLTIKDKHARGYWLALHAWKGSGENSKESTDVKEISFNSESKGNVSCNLKSVSFEETSKTYFGIGIVTNVTLNLGFIKFSLNGHIESAFFYKKNVKINGSAVIEPLDSVLHIGSEVAFVAEKYSDEDETKYIAKCVNYQNSDACSNRIDNQTSSSIPVSDDVDNDDDDASTSTHNIVKALCNDNKYKADVQDKVINISKGNVGCLKKVKKIKTKNKENIENVAEAQQSIPPSKVMIKQEIFPLLNLTGCVSHYLSPESGVVKSILKNVEYEFYFSQNVVKVPVRLAGMPLHQCLPPGTLVHFDVSNTRTKDGQYVVNDLWLERKNGVPLVGKTVSEENQLVRKDVLSKNEVPSSNVNILSKREVKSVPLSPVKKKAGSNIVLTSYKELVDLQNNAYSGTSESEQSSNRSTYNVSSKNAGSDESPLAPKNVSSKKESPACDLNSLPKKGGKNVPLSPVKKKAGSNIVLTSYKELVDLPNNAYSATSQSARKVKSEQSSNISTYNVYSKNAASGESPLVAKNVSSRTESMKGEKSVPLLAVKKKAASNIVVTSYKELVDLQNNATSATSQSEHNVKSEQSSNRTTYNVSSKNAASGESPVAAKNVSSTIDSKKGEKCVPLSAVKKKAGSNIVVTSYKELVDLQNNTTSATSQSVCKVNSKQPSNRITYTYDNLHDKTAEDFKVSGADLESKCGRSNVNAASVTGKIESMVFCNKNFTLNYADDPVSNTIQTKGQPTRISATDAVGSIGKNKPNVFEDTDNSTKYKIPNTATSLNKCSQVSDNVKKGSDKVLTKQIGIIDSYISEDLGMLQYKYNGVEKVFSFRKDLVLIPENQNSTSLREYLPIGEKVYFNGSFIRSGDINSFVLTCVWIVDSTLKECIDNIAVEDKQCRGVINYLEEEFGIITTTGAPDLSFKRENVYLYGIPLWHYDLLQLFKLGDVLEYFLSSKGPTVYLGFCDRDNLKHGLSQLELFCKERRVTPSVASLLVSEFKEMFYVNQNPESLRDSNENVAQAINSDNKEQNAKYPISKSKFFRSTDGTSESEDACQESVAEIESETSSLVESGSDSVVFREDSQVSGNERDASLKLKKFSFSCDNSDEEQVEVEEELLTKREPSVVANKDSVTSSKCVEQTRNTLSNTACRQNATVYVESIQGKFMSNYLPETLPAVTPANVSADSLGKEIRSLPQFSCVDPENASSLTKPSVLELGNTARVINPEFTNLVESLLEKTFSDEKSCDFLQPDQIVNFVEREINEEVVSRLLGEALFAMLIQIPNTENVNEMDNIQDQHEDKMSFINEIVEEFRQRWGATQHELLSSGNEAAVRGSEEDIVYAEQGCQTISTGPVYYTDFFIG